MIKRLPAVVRIRSSEVQSMTSRRVHENRFSLMTHDVLVFLKQC